jgi:hypothetical protein
MARRPTLSSGADLAGPGGGLAHAVEFAVQRQDEGGVLGDAQVVARDGHPLRGEFGDLARQRPRIDDDAIADDCELARPDYP